MQFGIDAGLITELDPGAPLAVERIDLGQGIDHAKPGGRITLQIIRG